MGVTYQKHCSNSYLKAINLSDDFIYTQLTTSNHTQIMRRINSDILFYIYKFISCLLIATLIFRRLNVVQMQLASWQLLIVQILLVYYYRKFKPLALFVIFAIPYTLVAHIHFLDPSFNLHFGPLTDFTSEYYYNGVFEILCIFWIVLTFFLPKLSNDLILKNYIKVKNNIIIFYSLLFIQILIVFFGKTGDTIFESGGYASPDSNVKSTGGLAIFEYFLVFYPVAYFYSGLVKRRLILLVAVAIFYCVKAVLFGGRVEIIQYLLMAFILHFDSPSLSLKKIAVVAFPLVLFLILFGGLFRGAPDTDLHSMATVLKENREIIATLVFGNHIDVYYSSTRLYGFCEDGILSIFERGRIFLLNILAIFVPYSKLPPEADLAAFKRDEYFAGGGALLPIYFFVYLSYFGVIVISSLLGAFFRKIIKFPQRVSMYFLFYIIMVLSTYPRWYAYSANVLYKYCLYSVVVLLFSNMISNYLSPKKSAIQNLHSKS